MFNKLIKLFVILGLFYQTPVYSKSASFNEFNARDLSNYFSGIIASENKNNSDALKFFNATKVLLKKHNPYCKIYTAEPSQWNDHELSFQANKRIAITNTPHGICDALESSSPGEITFEINNKNNVKGLSVDDEAIFHAMKFAYQEFNFILEPSGAIALACLMSSRSVFEGKKVLVLLLGLL